MSTAKSFLAVPIHKKYLKERVITGNADDIHTFSLTALLNEPSLQQWLISFGGTVRRKLICLCLCGTCFTTAKWITETLQNHRQAQTASQEHVNCDRSSRGRSDTSGIILISRFYCLFFFPHFSRIVFILYFILWPSPMHRTTAVPSLSLSFQSCWILQGHPHTQACVVGVCNSWKKGGKRKKNQKQSEMLIAFLTFIVTYHRPAIYQEPWSLPRCI